MKYWYQTSTLVTLFFQFVAAPAYAQVASSDGLPQISDLADIVVVAPNHWRIPVDEDSSFGEEEISKQHAATIGDLIVGLRSKISDDGSLPVILLNGKPMSVDQSILTFPPEALKKLSVVKSANSATYGASLGQQVINLVTKDSFQSLQAFTAVNSNSHFDSFDISESPKFFLIKNQLRLSANLNLSGGQARYSIFPADDDEPVGKCQLLTNERRSAVADFQLSVPLGDFYLSNSLNITNLTGSSINYRINRNNQDALSSFVSSIRLSSTLEGMVLGANSSFNLNVLSSSTESLSGLNYEKSSAYTNLRDSKARSYAAELNYFSRKSIRLGREITASVVIKDKVLYYYNNSSSLETDYTNSILENSWSVNGDFRVPLIYTGSMKNSLGEVIVNLSYGVGGGSRSGTFANFGFNLQWAPKPFLRVTFSENVYAAHNLSPGLNGSSPLITVKRIVDPLSGVPVDVTWINGIVDNNNSKNLYSLDQSFGIFLSGISSIKSNINFLYKVKSAVGGFFSITDYSPILQILSSDRVVRDGSGTIIKVDATAIPLDRSINKTGSVEMTASIPSELMQPTLNILRIPRINFDSLDVSFKYDHRFVNTKIFDQSVKLTTNSISQSGNSRNVIEAQIGMKSEKLSIDVGLSWSSSINIDPVRNIRLYYPMIMDITTSISLKKLFTFGSVRENVNNARLTIGARNVLSALGGVSGYIRDGSGKVVNNGLSGRIELSLSFMHPL